MIPYPVSTKLHTPWVIAHIKKHWWQFGITDDICIEYMNLADHNGNKKMKAGLFEHGNHLGAGMDGFM